MKTCKNCNQSFDNSDYKNEETSPKNKFLKFLKISICIILFLLIMFGSFLSFKFYVSMVGYVLHINLFFITPLIAIITSPFIPIWIIIFLFIKPYLTMEYTIISILTMLCTYFLYILVRKR